MEGGFNAQTVAPKQLGTAHPPGKFPAQITNTSIEPTKDGSGGMFIVEFTTQAGAIVFRYNIWNASDKAREIAQGQLSALCHVTGVFQLAWNNDGAALRGARCIIEVVEQLDKETKLPNGYTQIAKVYDMYGHEPGKSGQATPQPQPQLQQAQAAPLQNSGSGWGAPANPPQANAGNAPGWGGGNAAPPQNSAQPSAPANPSWQQGGNAAPAGDKPPWANR
jgi:hypothetical protein